MTATIATFSSILKEFYLGPIQDQLNSEVLALQMFEKMSVDWNGRHVIIPLHISRNTGVGYRGESSNWAADTALTAGQTLTAGQQGYTNYQVTAAFLYGRFEVTGPAIAAAGKGGKNTFIGWVDAEMNKLVDDVRDSANQTMVTGGRLIGFISERKQAATAGAGNSTSWTFDGDFTKLQALVTQALVVAMGPTEVRVSLIDTETYAPCTNGHARLFNAVSGSGLGSVDAGGGLIHLSDADLTTGAAVSTVDPGVAATDFAAIAVFVHDTQGTVPFTNFCVDRLDTEPVGVYGNLALPTLYTVDRSLAANANLRSTCLTHNGGAGGRGALVLARLQTMFDTILDTSGTEPDVMMMSALTRQQYVALMNTNLTAYTDKARPGDPGFLGLSYGGVPITTTRAISRGVMIFLKKSTWKVVELDPGKFADLDGDILSRLAASDSWEGFYKWYYNHVCLRPNANAVLCGINLN